MDKKNLCDLDVAGQKVLVRVDYNVPMDETGKITDDTRICASLETIKYLLEHKAAVILMAHLGRPKGQVNIKYSLAPVAKHLAKLLNMPVAFAGDCIGEEAEKAVQKLKPGKILMLENLRFHKEEEKNDMDFAEKLASLADLYVNDGFGVSHRAHASVEGVTHFLPSAAGFLLEKEIRFVGQAVENPLHPFVAIIGGAKVSDKIGVIDNLIEKADAIIIGGGMAYTFFAAQGDSIGTSLCEADKLDLAKGLLEKAAAKGVKLLLPVDNVVADAFSADANAKTVDSTQMPDGWMGLDIGPETIALFSETIATAKTVVWNGPMGVFEFDRFAEGTRSVAKAVADSSAISIIGGGDSAAAVEKLGYADQVTHISTGGGASLEFLEGKVLPGIDSLLDKVPCRTFAAGNWKMNAGTPDEAVKLITALKPLVKDATSKIALGVPFMAIPAALEATAYTNIKIAAQNCHFNDKGAYTGEISPVWLAKLGVTYVILGHSERREYFAETDETVNKKVKAALTWGLKPIVCCGESLDQRESGVTFDWIKGQIVGAFKDIPAEKLCQITIAYEPIWAIGTGKVASDEQAEEVCAFIRSVIADLYTKEDADALTIQYGGSVSATSAAGLFSQANINGGLVGGASLKAPDFAAICNA